MVVCASTREYLRIEGQNGDWKRSQVWTSGGRKKAPSGVWADLWCRHRGVERGVTDGVPRDGEKGELEEGRLMQNENPVKPRDLGEEHLTGLALGS